MRNIKQNAAIVSLAVLICGATVTAESGAVRAVIKPQQARTTAPDFRLQDAAGKWTSLSSLRGHVVLLNFWATECGGCRMELPYFIELDQRYRSKGFQTLGISMDVMYEGLKGPAEGWARVNPFVRDHRIEYPILMADNAISRAFHIDAMPATYLIDNRGRIAAKYVGVVDKADLEANIKTLLADR